MKTYRITASYITYCHAVIEANSEQEAYEQAAELDGAFFTPDQHNTDWQIDIVQEVQPTKE